MTINTKIWDGMTFEEYWALNKVRLLNKKFNTQEVAKQIWDDCISIKTT